MISFIHCGSDKRVYKFPKWQQVRDCRQIIFVTLNEFCSLSKPPLADAWKEMASYFYFEVFNQLEDHVLSYLTEVT